MPETSHSPQFLNKLDYSVLQQCMHCGMCLPTCPTYRETGFERNSPRGRISLMRAIADGEMPVTEGFGDEMDFCLGCLACMTACPANVNYAELFEAARAESEAARAGSDSLSRRFYRSLTLRGLFRRPRLLRLAGYFLRLWQWSGMQTFVRKIGLTHLLPRGLRDLEPMTPTVAARFSNRLIRPVEKPEGSIRYRVGVLTGCVQDLVFSDINRDTVDALLANGCEVVTPPVQHCCGSLHAHNGDLKTSREMARRMIDLFPPEKFDAIITNAAGCGSHLKHYDRLLADDPEYAERAAVWSDRLFDVNEWLVKIDFRPPHCEARREVVVYHDACHLCHGQGIVDQPRKVLTAVPGLELVPLDESTWCCGSAGVYNITQPEMATKLQVRKVENLVKAGAEIVSTANPGCLLQLKNGLQDAGVSRPVRHPVSILAEAYRREKLGR